MWKELKCLSILQILSRWRKQMVSVIFILLKDVWTFFIDFKHSEWYQNILFTCNIFIICLKQRKLKIPYWKFKKHIRFLKTIINQHNIGHNFIYTQTSKGDHEVASYFKKKFWTLFKEVYMLHGLFMKILIRFRKDE